jgi:hypothetical protein
MAHSPRSVVVAVSEDSRRAELLEALLGDSNDFDVFFMEPLAHGYSRIKQLRPDLIVISMATDDSAACQLLSMLAIDREVSGIPIVPFVSKRNPRDPVPDPGSHVVRGDYGPDVERR